MPDFLFDIDQTNDIHTLVSLKEEIKNQVTDKQLTWQERVFLYQKVQLINQRIESLQNLLV